MNATNRAAWASGARRTLRASSSSCALRCSSRDLNAPLMVIDARRGYTPCDGRATEFLAPREARALLSADRRALARVRQRQLSDGPRLLREPSTTPRRARRRARCRPRPGAGAPSTKPPAGPSSSSPSREAAIERDARAERREARARRHRARTTTLPLLLLAWIVWRVTPSPSSSSSSSSLASSSSSSSSSPSSSPLEGDDAPRYLVVVDAGQQRLPRARLQRARRRRSAARV